MIKSRQTVRGAISAVEIIAAYQEAFNIPWWRLALDFIARLVGLGSIFQLADQYYREVDEELIRDILKADKTNLEQYQAEDFDCDDFAFRLMGVLHQNRDTAAMPIYITWIKFRDGIGHALLSYYCKGEVKIVEPQNDDIYAVPGSWRLDLLCG